MKIPFDIKYRPQIESGEYKVETRDGRKARIIHWDLNCTSPIVAVMDAHIDLPGEIVDVFSVSGRAFDDLESPSDLFLVTPEEEMTEFEIALENFVMNVDASEQTFHEDVKQHAAELLELAKNEILRSDKWIIGNDALRLTYERGKAEALKDLPRWREWGNGAAGNSDGHPIALVSGAGGIRFVSVLGITGEKYIMLDDLKKLPGFKED